VLRRAAAFATLGALSPLLTAAPVWFGGVPFLDGLTFGVILAAYLRVCRGVRAAGRLLSLLAVSAGALA